MTTILAFAFVLGVLIFVHELGHFIVAKRIGIRAEKFSLGFGPKLFGFTKGETEYVLSAFPLGGYVKLAGENLDEELNGEPWEFASRTVFERMRVVFCGPLMNIILSVVLMFFVFMLGRNIPEYLMQFPVVGWVEKDSPGERAGFNVGDRVISVNKHLVDNWEQLLLKVASNNSDSQQIKVDRGGKKVTLTMAANIGDHGEMEGIGIYPPIPAKVGALTPGYPAEKAGLKVGDMIIAINDEVITHWFQFSNIIHHSYGQELILTIQREFGPMKVKVTPKKDTLQGGIGLIGVQSDQKMILKKYGFREAMPQAFKEVGKLLGLTVDFFKKLVTGSASAKSIGGPIAIAQIAGQAAESGASDLLFLMAFLSLQLGVLNLLPIPILDGGLILFLIIEAIIKKPLNLRTREVAQQVGLTIILMIMVFAFYNDIMRLFG